MQDMRIPKNFGMVVAEVTREASERLPAGIWQIHISSFGGADGTSPVPQIGVAILDLTKREKHEYRAIVDRNGLPPTAFARRLIDKTIATQSKV